MFYGRVSTEDHQDPVTSQARQRAQAGALVTGFGRIVGEYFGVGQSRVLPWVRRPEAAALLVAMADPDRGFDAIVVGEYERAFYGSQFALMAPLFEHYGVQFWLPEVGGRVDFSAEGHEQMMIGLGIQSKREITRTRIRVLTSMAAQAREQGRYLGGRPPYGYRLVDAGPHPNRAHAAWGRRTLRLEPDPGTAPIVRWMFAQRLAGHSLARIARALNDMQVPCPSAADPVRNAHRSGAGWAVTTVGPIVGNPRYTGRQVWNRQPTEHELIDPGNTGLGHRQVQRWGLPDGWVISTKPAHPALVSEEDFIAVQGMRAARVTAHPDRRYLLAALLGCGVCGRRLESCWANGREAYRCRHGHTTATGPAPARARNLYVRQDRILPHLQALYLLLSGPDPVDWSAVPPADMEVIEHLRNRKITLIYDPVSRTLRTATPRKVSVILDRAHWPGRSRAIREIPDVWKGGTLRPPERPHRPRADAWVASRHVRICPAVYKLRVRGGHARYVHALRGVHHSRSPWSGGLSGGGAEHSRCSPHPTYDDRWCRATGADRGGRVVQAHARTLPASR
ncbi:recombinase family protein [Microbispora sp. NBC_01389]|uniref:recombinase family protein n=1 Tax=Microbispora sp. NBC_01389 TaxID=2903584 RepID=UPI003256060F